jgi:hypothetical protein
MSLTAAVGLATAIEGRDASAQAARQALGQLTRKPVAIGFVFASDDYGMEQVLGGAAPVLGDTPLIGLSTTNILTNQGSSQRSVAVALLAGGEMDAQAAWWPDFDENSRAVTETMANTFQLWDEGPEKTLFLVVDGLSGDFSELPANLPAGNYVPSGCLAGGNLKSGRTYQIGGSQTGSGGLAAALLSGNIKSGVGVGHGWQPIGIYFKVTQANGPWVRTLDGKPAADAYAQLFGYEPRDWSFPPLNEMVRLYPLGIETEGQEGLLVRSPLRVEADGSLRMSTPVPTGSTCHLLLGSVEACQKAACEAARQALDGLENAQPVLALLLVDISWQTLLEADPGLPIQALHEVLGTEIPIAGAYTYGQIAQTPASEKIALLNQHIEVLIIGEPK